MAIPYATNPYPHSVLRLFSGALHGSVPAALHNVALHWGTKIETPTLETDGWDIATDFQWQGSMFWQ